METQNETDLSPSGPYHLYGTSACHLCELAEELLCALIDTGGSINYVKVDISDSDQLFERYGIRIPVLRHPAGAELGWPFTLEELEKFTDEQP